MASIYKKRSDRRRRGSSWYIRYRSADGRHVSVKGCPDHAATKFIAQELESQAELARRGVISPAQERCVEQGGRPIGEHIAEFIRTVESRERAPRTVQQIRSRIEAFVRFAECRYITELRPEQATAFRLELRARTLGRDKSKYSNYTIREYINNLKAFTDWAWKTGRLASDPLQVIDRVDEASLRKKHPRRALTPDEFGALLEVTQQRPLWELQTIRTGARRGQRVAKLRPEVEAAALTKGRQRFMAYLVAFWTGLRRSELGAIEWGDVGLDNLPAKLELRKGLDKSKRGDTIALHPQVAESLREFKPSDAKPSDRIFGTVPGMKVLRADLKAAGIPFKTRQGCVDLHALRKSLNTYLASQGVGQRIAQAHMRHTDPRLTAGAYTDESQLPIASAISGLPAMPTRRASEKKMSSSKAVANA